MDKIMEINKLAKNLPLWVIQDVNNRITDWISSGGSAEDPYIDQQLKFVRRFISIDKGE